MPLFGGNELNDKAWSKESGSKVSMPFYGETMLNDKAWSEESDLKVYFMVKLCSTKEHGARRAARKNLW